MLLTQAKLAHRPQGSDLGDQAMVVRGDAIVWIGELKQLPDAYHGERRVDLGGRLVTPGLIDCHTHVVHGGHRAREFEMRLEGASYEEVARAGGGIISTVAATREASEDELVGSALPRVDALIAEGVTTLEIKSGYGLDQETELRMLRAARRIATLRPVDVRTSFLGAHAVPKGADADTYITDVAIPALNAAHAEGLVDAVDGFCEGIAFTPAQIARVFDVARDLGLPVKLHAEQLSNLGGAAMAAGYGALSADRSLNFVGFTPDGELFISEHRGTLHYHNVNTGEPVATIDAIDPKQGDHTIFGGANQSRDRSTIVTAGWHGQVRVWDAASRELVCSFDLKLG